MLDCGDISRPHEGRRAQTAISKECATYDPGKQKLLGGGGHVILGTGRKGKASEEAALPEESNKRNLQTPHMQSDDTPAVYPQNIPEEGTRADM